MQPWRFMLAVLAIGLAIASVPVVSNARTLITLETAAEIALNSVVGESDERISSVAPTLDAFEPDVAYNPVTNQYLVVYARPRAGGGANEFEIYGQFVDAATGALVAPAAPGAEVSGTAFRISRNGNDRSNDPFDAYSPAVSYSERDNVFLVAWTADNTNPLIDCNNPDAGRAGYRAGGAFEIYVQVVTANGDLLIRDECGSPQDDRITEINVLFYQNNFESRNPDWDAFSPDVAYNSRNGEFLICWSDDRANNVLSQPFAEQGGEFEIRCQRFSLDPHPNRRFIGQIGPNDFLISRAGFTTTVVSERPNYDAVTPAIAYNSVDNQWFVVWSADNNASGVEDGEFEIYGQVLAADGTQAHLLPGIGANYRDDHRISQVGENTGCANSNCDAYRPVVAHNPDRNQYLVAWFGDNTNGFEEVYASLRQPTGSGTNVSGQQVSFSSRGTDNRLKGLDVDVVYDAFSREWLIVWRGDPAVNDRFEIYGQRFNADTDGSAPLAQVGGGNFLIGSTPALAPSAFQASASGLARPLPAGETEIAGSTTYNPVNWHRVAPRIAATGAGRFMTVWAGYLNGVAADRQFEVFSRRLSFVPPAVQSVERSDGVSVTPLNDGDLVNGIINDLRIAFAEQLRNGDNP
ncbi:MAG: hyalin, partial [Chloroflexus sp.]|nr:hyalin [Chloroflexus sp.]